MEIKIKVSSGDPGLSKLLIRQTPQFSSKWKNRHFYVNQNVDECDWWFVLHSGGLRQRETTNVDPAKVVFISMEPIDTLPSGFYKQFSKLVLCDKNVKHSSIEYQNGTTWWAGINVNYQISHDFSASVNHDYESLKLLRPPADQLNKISIITSNKSDLPGHRARLRFIDKVMNSSVASLVDLYGGGHNPVQDKMDAILPYKYHIVLENSIVDHYWTEKLGDAFLGWSFPFYSGCRNIDAYFPCSALAAIDIESTAVIDEIKKAFDEDLYSQRINDIDRARNMILDKYNIFELMASIATSKSSHAKQKTLKPWNAYLPLRRKIRSAVSPMVKRLVHRG